MADGSIGCPGERDVLDLMTQGLTTVAIATRLSLVGTVADRADRRLIQRGNVPLLLCCN